MVEGGAFSHKIDYVKIFEEILNLKGHQNRTTGSRVTAILLHMLVLPVGGVALKGSAPAACAAGLLICYLFTFIIPFSLHVI